MVFDLKFKFCFLRYIFLVFILRRVGFSIRYFFIFFIMIDGEE